MSYDHGNLRDLVEFMAKALVDFPDQVDVKEEHGEQTTVIALRVAKDDVGKVIGKEGRTAKAMRKILQSAGTKLKKRTILDILE